jgi:putative ABC transport system substrate-binding protein
MASHIERRKFLAVLLGGAAVAWPLAARAQLSGMPVIGLLWPGDAPPVSPRMESFRQGLRALGLVDGQNVAIELRYAQRGLQQLPELAAELISLKVDVILAPGDLAPKVPSRRRRRFPLSRALMTSLVPGSSPVSRDSAGTPPG